jgi:hypothetical protein
MLQLVVASHDGITSLITMIYIGITSPTSTSHVGDSSKTYASHVKDLLLASASHAGSMSPATASHAGIMSPTTASHVGGINMIAKNRRIGRKPKFLCILYKVYHLTRMCHATSMVQEAQSLSDSPSGSKSYLVSQHSNPSLVDTSFILMQYLVDTTLIFGCDSSLDHVVSHHVQPIVVSIQPSIKPTLLLGGDASFNHVLRISSFVPFEKGSIPLSLSTLPPSPRVVSFDWNDLVEPQIPSSTPFQIRVIL